MTESNAVSFRDLVAQGAQRVGEMLAAQGAGREPVPVQPLFPLEKPMPSDTFPAVPEVPSLPPPDLIPPPSPVADAPPATPAAPLDRPFRQMRFTLGHQLHSMMMQKQMLPEELAAGVGAPVAEVDDLILGRAADVVLTRLVAIGAFLGFPFVAFFATPKDVPEVSLREAVEAGQKLGYPFMASFRAPAEDHPAS